MGTVTTVKTTVLTREAVNHSHHHVHAEDLQHRGLLGGVDYALFLLRPLHPGRPQVDEVLQAHQVPVPDALEEVPVGEAPCRR